MLLEYLGLYSFTGAYVDHEDNSGDTALILASLNGHLGVVRIMIAAGGGKFIQLHSSNGTQS